MTLVSLLVLQRGFVQQPIDIHALRSEMLAVPEVSVAVDSLHRTLASMGTGPKTPAVSSHQEASLDSHDERRPAADTRSATGSSSVADQQSSRSGNTALKTDAAPSAAVGAVSNGNSADRHPVATGLEEEDAEEGWFCFLKCMLILSFPFVKSFRSQSVLLFN